MAVVIETTLGDITVDLYLEQRPATCLNFLKLCKMKYYNFNLFHTIRSGFIAQTGDPTGEGSGGESIWGLLEGPEKRFFSGEKMPKIRHTDAGLLSMVCTDNMMVGSQFFFTLAPDLDSLDGVHCVIGEVTEGHEVLTKLNEVICDETHRPYQDVRITHTVVLEDPFNDLPGLRPPSRSPSPNAERLKGGRIAPDEEIDETQGKSHEEIQEMIEEKEAKARATILEIVGDLPDADIAPPENVLFVCKLNPVTTDDDLEIIFSRFGKIVSCEVIRDKKTGDSLQYAFIEFENKESCEDAYFKMDNVLIDDRRIHVDFSQSVSKMRWLGKGRGVQYFNDKESKPEVSNNKSKRSHSRERNDSKQHNRDRDNRGRVTKNREKDGENRGRDRENRDRDRENSNRNRENRERVRENRERDGENKEKDRENRERDRHNRDRDRENRERDRENRERDQRYRNDMKSNNADKERERSRSRPRKDVSKSDSKSDHTRYNKNDSREDSNPKHKDYSHVNKSEKRNDNNHYDNQGLHKNFTRDHSSSDEREQKNSDNHKKHTRDRSNDRHTNISHKTSNRDTSYESQRKEIKHSNNSSRSKEQRDHSKSSKGAREVAPHTPSPVVNEKNKTKKNDAAKMQKKDKNKLRKTKKKRKPSTSSSDSETSDSSSSSSESTSSSEGHKKKRLSKRRKRHHSSSSSSSSSTSSSDSSSTTSSSSSDSSGSTSESDDGKKKRKRKGNKKSGKKTKKL